MRHDYTVGTLDLYMWHPELWDKLGGLTAQMGWLGLRVGGHPRPPGAQSAFIK